MFKCCNSGRIILQTCFSQDLAFFGSKPGKFKSPTRLECMMQDFPRLCTKEDKVGFTQLERFLVVGSSLNRLTV